MLRQARRRRSRGCVDWRARSDLACALVVVDDVDVDRLEVERVLRARRVSGRPGAEGAERVGAVVEWF